MPLALRSDLDLAVSTSTPQGTPPNQRQRRWQGQGGSAAFYAIFVVFVAVLAVGLVVDGGTIRNARRDAADIAQQAARAGAQQVDEGSLLVGGDIRLDPAKASAAAHLVVGSRGAAGSVGIVGQSVTVEVTKSVDLMLLGGARTVSATRSVDAADA